MNDAIIVGAGPAGVSCALWLKQLGFSCLLVDSNDRCGGLQLKNPFTNTWIASSAKTLGSDIASALQQNVVDHGIQTKLGVQALSASKTGDRWRVSLAGQQDEHSRVLVLATGVSMRTGGFVERAGMLVGPGPNVNSTDFTGARVAILGGGDNAFENFDFALARGAAEVRIYARNLRARADMLARVPATNVELGDYTVDSDKKTVNGEAFDFILVLYGYEAGKSALLGLTPALRPDGFVLTTPDCRTSVDGLYAIGEIAQRAHPCCVTAMADGVIAAKDIQRRLEANASAKYQGMFRRGVAMTKKLASAL